MSHAVPENLADALERSPQNGQTGLCGELVVHPSAAVFDAATGRRHQQGFRVPGTGDAFDPAEYYMSDWTCAAVGQRHIAVVMLEPLNSDLTLLAAFGSDGEYLWSRRAAGYAGPAVVDGLVVVDPPGGLQQLLDPVTGHVERTVSDDLAVLNRAHAVDQRKHATRVTDLDGDPTGIEFPRSFAYFFAGGERLLFAEKRSEFGFYDYDLAGFNLRTGQTRRSERSGFTQIDARWRWVTVDASNDIAVEEGIGDSVGRFVLYGIDVRNGRRVWERRQFPGVLRFDAYQGVVLVWLMEGGRPRLLDTGTGKTLRLDPGLYPIALGDAGLLVLDEDDEPRLVDPQDVTTPQR